MPAEHPPERRRLLELTRTALRLAPAERRTYLEDACRDPEVRRLFEETLADTDPSLLEPAGALRGALWDDLIAVLSPAGEAQDGASDERFVGQLVGRIRVDRLLAAGGMGEVYEGFDELLERPVAVKTLHPEHDRSAASRLRFLREARLLSRLDHPHVCRLYDLVEHDGREALVLELVEGKTLRQRTTEQPALSETEKLTLGAQIASGLAAAHRAGVIHRDLKPSNVMLAPDGSVKIIDFGIARHERGGEEEAGAEQPPASVGSSTDVTLPGSTVGTIAYMSPEQARGEELTPASDLFSLGILLQELFTGASAYTESDPERLLAQVRRAELSPPTGVTPKLRALLAGLLAGRPEERPAAAEAERRLWELAHGPQRARRRRRLVAAVAGGLGLCLLSALFAWRSARPKPIFSADETVRLAVLPFVNATGDPSVDWVENGLAEMLSENLAELPEVEVVPFGSVLELLDGRGETSGGSPSASAAVLGAALGANVVVATHVERSGGGYRLGYQPERIGVASRQRWVESDDLVVGANELSARLTGRLAPEALAPDIRDSFSESPLANRLYAMGVQRFHANTAASSEPFFRVALELDSDFTRAEVKLAHSLALQSRWDAAEAQALGVVEATRGAREDLGQSAALGILASVAHGRDDYEAAVRWGEEAVSVAEAMGDPERIAQAAYTLGRSQRFLDVEAALGPILRAEELYQEIGNRLGEARAVHMRGILATERDEAEVATPLFERALGLARELDAYRLQAIALDSLAIQATERGEYEEAARLLDESLISHERSGDPRALIFTLSNLGDVYHFLEQPEQAESVFLRADALCAEVEAPAACALVSFNYSEILLSDGRTDEALRHIERAEEFFGADDPDLIYVRAVYWASTGDLGRGRRTLQRAVEAVDPARGETYRTGFLEATS